jgi:hypothetical protein
MLARQFDGYRQARVRRFTGIELNHQVSQTKHGGMNPL